MRMLPGLRSLSFRGSAMCFARTKAMLAADGDSVGMGIALGDGVRMAQRSAELVVRAGDAFPMLSDEPGSVTGHGHLGLLFPRAPLTDRLSEIADFANIRIPRESEALRLLVGYLSALPEKIAPNSTALRRAFVDHVYDLVTLAIGPHRSPNENSLGAAAAARLEIALSYITVNFQRPDLTITDVARDQNVSPRYVQRLIETTGMTFSERVQELRLQYAFELLTSARHRHERISDIALRAGFSDVAHFNRSFRKRFGDTPSHTRTGTGLCQNDK